MYLTKGTAVYLNSAPCPRKFSVLAQGCTCPLNLAPVHFLSCCPEVYLHLVQPWLRLCVFMHSTMIADVNVKDHPLVRVS